MGVVKPQVNQPLPPSRHYYPRPIPASILFEENAMNLVLSYDSKSLYEWNNNDQFDY